MENADYDVVIIGSGIAGLSAAIYAGRSGHKTLVLKGPEPGGQLTLTTDVANYPGFPDGISGPELVQKMTIQAETFGAAVESASVVSVDTSTFPRRVTLERGDSLTTTALIIASGASARTLGIPGESALMGYGVSTCATCDGAFFRDQPVAVVGGGDAALEEACFLTKFASTVHLIHRRDEFRAEAYWQERVNEKIDGDDGDIVFHPNTEVVEIVGSKESGVDRIKTLSHPDGSPTTRTRTEAHSEGTIDVDAVFIAIGHIPNTDFLQGTGVGLDADDYLQTRPGETAHETQTGVEGVFGAGDVVDSHYQQAATAAGMGVKAALDADAFLSAR